MGIARTTLQSHIKSHQEKHDTKQGLSSDLLHKVVKHYAYKGNKTCQDFLDKFDGIGAKMYIYHEAGYQIDAKPRPPQPPQTHILPQTYLEALKAFIEKEEAYLREKSQHDKVKLQFDKSTEYISIKRVASINDISWKEISWRKLKKATVPPKKIFDSNYGEVNAYHKTAWQQFYPDLKLE